MLDIINIVHKNQRLANVYITIIGQFATDCHRLASTKLFSLAKTLYHNDRITNMNVT
jgi:hypothetical protein